MAARKPPQLRAVGPDDKPPAKKQTRKRTAAKKKPTTIVQAAESGELRATLVAVRNRLAKILDDPATPPRDFASNSRRFLEVVKELEELDRASDDVFGRAAATRDEEWDASAI